MGEAQVAELAVDQNNAGLTRSQARAIVKDDEIRAHTGWTPYDPDRQLAVRYADVIGARNAVGHLLTILNRGAGTPTEVECMQDTVRMGVAVAVFNDRHHEFATFDDAAAWLEELQLRLTRSLPTPVTVGDDPEKKRA